MKNKSKTDWKLVEDTTEKFNRYGIRKYNVGAASIAILSGLFFLEQMRKRQRIHHLKRQHKLLYQRVEVVPRLILGKRL